ncbi:Ca2+-transporting ATPase [Steroidobacter denitrificans]|uniref:Ca2+-transporting ATPase n=1 Tax=Steroidobacter denitrificans TaxID=465721 RepID=A0A127FE34_STEDE|nr:cation-transporting P-type ATPase [Steroidobacter denitrificans]AMN48041.1 Ca2+-transporting ATPase [Steroidobacter denitrificans]
MQHHISSERIAGLDPDGLTIAQVVERRSRYGTNDIVTAAPSGWREVMRETVRDPMIWFLIGTALIFLWLGDLLEATILAVALLPIIIMDGYLHRRTQVATEGLSDRLAPTARVLRDGAWMKLPAREIVVGDTVLVEESQPFPADGIVLAGENLQAEESALTGEALPVRKRPLPQDTLAGLESGADEIAVDHEAWGAAGTRLLTGEAHLRVVFTGAETLYGAIAHSAHAGSHERTPLQQALGSLVATLVVAAVVICLALAATRYYQGHGVVDALVSAVTLAVAALPEEFPVVYAFFLGVGVHRLARHQALVRRAVVVENIGRVSCICSDKTGTLTEGRLRLEHLLPSSSFTKHELLLAAARASRPASVDPMDREVLARLADVSLGAERIATFPFTEDRRREVGIVRDATGDLHAFIKGAPETILVMTDLSTGEREEWQRTTLEFASTGHKVIAVASRPLPHWAGGEPDRGYTFLGLLVFEDPLRPSAAEAVRKAVAAGIRVIMVTGDHPATAQAIAAKAGIGAAPPRVIEGTDLVERLRRKDPDCLQDVDVVARSAPSQKLDLVRALQASGEIVAVTGDGVNDVPALQGADIGIAMGERGTRSAREVASIVLLDDNFRTIIRAIAEGRQLFENLKFSFAYLLMVHIPLVLTAAFIPFAGFALVYLPVHIVWLELIIHPTALLVFQQLPSSDELHNVHNTKRPRFFDTTEWVLIGLAGLVVTLAVTLGYVRSLGAMQDVEHARGMAMVTLVVASAAITAGLSGLRTRTATISVVAAIASAAVLVQHPVLAELVHLSPLHADDWMLATVAGLLPGAIAALLPLRRRLRK